MMKKIAWLQVDDIRQDWEYRKASIEALREIAEQLASVTEAITRYVKTDKGSKK